MSDHEDAAPELKPEDAPLVDDEDKPEVAPAGAPEEAGLGDDDDDDDDGPVVARRRERRGAVLDDESDDDDDDDDSAAKKKKRKAQELELDEDDYDLLEDNQVTGFRRPKEKKKRLQKAADREKGASGKEKQKPKTVRDVERDLFGDDDDDEPGPGASEKPKPEAAPVDEGDADLEASDSEDEFADFIEREEGEKPRRKLKSSMTGVRSEQLQDAVDIFGDLGELQELFARRNVEVADEGEEEEEGEEEDAFIAPEDGDEAPGAAQPRRRRKGKKVGVGLPGKWQSVFEPSIVREQMLTAADDAVRREDWPERLQLSPRPGGAPEDAQAVATWIFDRMMGVGSVRDLPTFGGDLLLSGWNDDESNEDHEARVRYREQTSGGSLPKKEADAVVLAIADLLHMVHVEGLEMPYVAQHLKDRVAPLLRGRRDDSRPPPRDASGAVLERRVHRRDVLHEVMEWDERHARMTRRRKSLEAKIDAVSALLARERADHPDLPVTAALANAAADAETDEALDDVDAKLALRFDEQLVALSEREAAAAAARGDAKAAERTLRPLNRTQYAHHVKKGLRDLLPLYGASPESLAERLVTYRGGEAESAVPDMSPEEAASVYVGPETGYETTEHVLKALTHVAAAEISAEPGVRAWLRAVVRRKACVWTQPTPAGTEAIDPFHPLAGIKRLQEKPVCDFDGSEFAATLKAHREGLVKLRIALPDRVADEVVADAEAAYLLEQSTPMADAWNALRREALDRGVRQHLVKALTREAAVAMEREARVHVRRECGEALWRRVAVAPWRPETRAEAAGDSPSDASVDVRVLAAVWGPGDPPSTFAMLDADGELVDFLQCPNIAIRAPKSGGAAVARQQADLDRLLKFMIEHRPHAVCVAASAAAGTNARLLKDAVAMVVGRIVEDHARAIPEEVDTIKVHFVDDVVPALAGQCAAQRAEFVEHSHEVRRAVALGRYVRDPPGVIAQLASGGEARSMTLSPLQDSLTEEEKASVFQRTLVDVVNQVGVDLNAAVAHPWRQFALRYVCGLGPRKAGALVAAVRAGDGGAVESRAELLRVERARDANANDSDDDDAAAARNPLGPVVFRNAAASLLVAEAEDPLDATRVHPEDYARCLEIVANALEYDFEQLKAASGGVRRKAFERAMDPENWDKLAVLDLRAYAEYLAGQGQGWTLETLRETRMELRAPYGELREPWREHTPWEEFTLLTGETAHSLCPGKIVHATVKKLQPPRRDVDGVEIGTGHVVVALDSGVTGIVAKEDLSDRLVERLEHKVAVGQVIAGRVKPNGLDLEANAVHLSCKGSVLSVEESARWEHQAWQHKRYYSFDVLDGERPKPKPKKKKQNENRGFIARNIDHPLFQNVSFQGAQKFLLDKEIGEVVLRPSSKGVSQLSMTLKFSDESYVHYDIREGAKAGVGHTANLALGSPLTLEGEEYEDLDEVYARHIEPMVKHIRAAHAHRKFRRGDKREVDLRLKAEMARAPNTRPYAISVATEHQGVFCLSAILSKSGTVHHEYFSCKPEGFRFRRIEFPTVDRMLDYFKVNPNAPRAARPAPAPPPQAPMGAAAGAAPAYGAPPFDGAYPPAAYPPAGPYGQPPPGYYGGAPPVQAYGGYYGGQTPMGAHGYPPQGPPPGQPPPQYQQRY